MAPPNQRKRRAGRFRIGAVLFGLLGGGACLSMPTGTGDNSRKGPPPLVPDSVTGTWLVSVDTANVAPFEVFVFKAPDDSGSVRLSGVSGLPDFASGMGLNVIQAGPVSVTLDGQTLAIHGLVLGQSHLVFLGSRCGQDLCGALFVDSDGQASFLDVARASRDWAVAFNNRYSEPPFGMTPLAGASLVLRLDDASIDDTASLRLATDLNLPVSLGIPTGLVGDRWHLDWSTIEEFADQSGGMPLVHSRTHGSTPHGLLSALNEFAEAKRDFEARDLLPYAFVQPGGWQGAFEFDSATKLASPYGVMLDHLYLGIQAYVSPAFRLSPASRSSLLGRTHFTLDQMTTTSVEQLIAAVRSRVGVVVWLWHSNAVDPQVLAYFLQRVASLRDSGVVDVLSPAGELLARQSRPVWDGVAVSDTAPRHIQFFAPVLGTACPDSILVTAWDLELPPGCGFRLTAPLVESGWPVRAIVSWSGQTRLRVRLIPVLRTGGGESEPGHSTRGTLTRSFSYFAPRLSDRAVTVVLENVGSLPLQISEFRLGLF